MAFSDAILNMLGKKDPRLQLMAALQQGATPATPGAGGDTSTAAGGGAGAAAPEGAAAQPQAYQSPPDLVNLYTQLTERENKARMIDNGIALMGASVAQPENRDLIMRTYGAGGSSGGGGGGGSSDPMSFISQMMDFSMKNQALQRRAALRASLPGLAKQYGMSLEAAQYLFDNDKLDSVIQEAAKPDRQIVENSDGTHVIVNTQDGSIGTPFGVPKRREVELVDDPATGSKYAVYKDTKERVGGGKQDLPGLGATNDEKLWRADNADRKSRGMPERPLGEFLRDTGQSRAGASNVTAKGANVGNPPTDMAWKRDSQGNVDTDENGAPLAVPIQGTKLAQTQAGIASKTAKQADQKRVTNTVVTTGIDDALKLINEHKNDKIGNTGVAAQVLSGVGNTDANELKNTLLTIQTNIGIDKLNEMRAASPTGGALGQVSDYENKMLQAAYGSLAQEQSPETLERNLRRIRRLYEGVVNGDFGAADAIDQEAIEQAMQEADSEGGTSELDDGSPDGEQLKSLLEKYK